MKKPAILIATLVAALSFSAAVQAQTLEDVQDRDMLRCGVSDGLPGFSVTNSDGDWVGLDVDTCKAVAAAVLGDSEKVEFVSLTAVERFTALQSGEIDMLSRNTTWTTTRDTSLGINFTGTNYYDGQGFLISRDLGVNSATQLNGAAVCVASGTTTELNLADYFEAQGMEFEPVLYDTSDQTVAGFEAGRCDVLTSDTSQLAALRIQLSDPESAMVLPEIISKEPLGPAVRQGDDQWFNIVKWTLFLQINAEEYGVSSGNVDAMLESENPNVSRIVGTSGDLGDLLDLPEDWGYQVISQVGNYAEMFERNVGPDTALELERGTNALWTDGGIMYAPPMR